jgi:RNA polymerase sigma factor for flagellar operon FliA
MHSLVARYASTRSDESELILRYASVIERSARSIVARSGGLASIEDLWSVGALGLLDAARRFDPSRGVRLETFLERRVRGAMLDELRRMDHLPRRLRQRASEMRSTKSQLLGVLGREPTRDEVAKALEISVEDVEAIESVLDPPTPLGPEHDSALQFERPNLEDGLGHGVSAEALAEAITVLPERLQILLSLRYVEGLTLREISQVLGVSEPRVSQLHQNAIDKLRISLAPTQESID